MPAEGRRLPGDKLPLDVMRASTGLGEVVAVDDAPSPVPPSAVAVVTALRPASPKPAEVALFSSGSPAKLVDPGEASVEAIALSRALGLSITAADVLHRRGRGVDDATRRFLDPRLSHLTPPDAMADRDKSAERIARAVRAKERICVFGDYDCDGITSTAITTGILRALGGEVVPLLATRLEGSYGLSAPALKRVLATGATLLVTCDCGSSDHERLAVARARGLDVVVIDHHLVPAEPLPAFAFLNPHRPECGFPYKGMASCGLALSLGAAVRKALGAELDLRVFLDLVAIGTIADVAPLDGDNRALVRAGLAAIGGAPFSRGRPGLRALADNAKVDLGAAVRAEDVAFRLAPRLNAPGRLGDPDLSLQLLLEQSPVNAVAIAAQVEQLAVKRRAIQDEMLADALAEIHAAGYAHEPAIVLARQGWHPGVVGIVAGRIASRFGRPTIVVGLEGEKGRGSVRGPAGSRLHDALGRCKHALVGFGGHQAAAGVEVRADRVQALRDAWCEAYASVPRGRGEGEADADVRLDDRDDPAAVARDLLRLEPCGEANRAPRLLLAGARVTSAKNLKGHLKLEVSWSRRTLTAFGFELGPLADGLGGRRADLLGHLRFDTWRGGDAVELRLERIAPE
jgi:single-stranded-DNA-specific exonuclease